MLERDHTGAGNAGRGVATYAAIDLGTNNCRLLVARPAVNGFKVVDAFSRVVRLGDGLAGRGRLQDEAMDRAVGALRICSQKMRNRGVRRARAVATEACRRAGNGARFLGRAADSLGLPVETIEPDEEASLALAGCRSLLDEKRDRGILVDIGGGSTQIVWFSTWSAGRFPSEHMLASVSLPLGVVSLADRFGSADPDVMFATVELEMSPSLAAFDAVHLISGAIAEDRVQAIGTSGTITTLAGLALGLDRYERRRVDGARMTCDEIVGLSRHLAALTVDERVRLPCVGRARADLLVAGCAILLAICRRWPIGVWTAADRGLREGILLDLMVADGYLGG